MRNPKGLLAGAAQDLQAQAGGASPDKAQDAQDQNTQEFQAAQTKLGCGNLDEVSILYVFLN